MASTFQEINLSSYILNGFTVTKLAAPTVDVVFQDEEKETLSKQHGQLKCNASLKFPFAKEDYRPVALPIKHATVLLDANPVKRAKEVIEVVFDSSALNPLDYFPGDTIAILPQNTKEEVCFLLEAIQLVDKANQACQVQVHAANCKKIVKLPHIPQHTTPTELLRDILNIRAVPKKQFLRALSHCCTVNDEQDFLNCLASKEGSLYYNELLLEKGLTLVDLLHLCTSCKPSLSLLIEHLPRLMPRPYSIANSPLTHENELKIIFSILNERPGIVTSMLASMAHVVMKGNVNQPPTVLAYPRQINNFRYTTQEFTSNQILIAIGTALAPYLGFLEHKAHLLSSNTPITPGSTWLFVGAAIEAAIPHRTEILELNEKHQQRVLERYFESFSRVPDAAFHYVQEQFIAHAQDLVEFLMKDETTLYVCADGAQISQAIESSLSLCLQQELELTADEAKELLKHFRSNGKYREDLWT